MPTTAPYPSAPAVRCFTCGNESAAADVVTDGISGHVCTWPDGTVYLIHFAAPLGGPEPYKTARHYTGHAADLAARLDLHRSGNGAAIMAEVARRGIAWQVARTWPGDRSRERQIKRQGGASRHCPLCKIERTTFATEAEAEAADGYDDAAERAHLAELAASEETTS